MLVPTKPAGEDGSSEAGAKPGLPRRSSGETGAKPGRSLTWFYAVMGVVIALTLFSVWFWKTWNVWWFDAAEARHRQSEAAARLGRPVETEIDLGDGVKLELVLVPPGRFRMGSPAEEAGRYDSEEQHWVMITKAFYIAPLPKGEG
jgi:formylglycine-generating enzyme required for sulfatase activity